MLSHSYGVHITPLAINSLGGGHTNTHHGPDKFLETRHALASGMEHVWFKNHEFFIRVAGIQDHSNKQVMKQDRNHLSDCQM